MKKIIVISLLLIISLILLLVLAYSSISLKNAIESSPDQEKLSGWRYDTIEGGGFSMGMPEGEFSYADGNYYIDIDVDRSKTQSISIINKNSLLYKIRSTEGTLLEEKQILVSGAKVLYRKYQRNSDTIQIIVTLPFWAKTEQITYFGDAQGEQIFNIFLGQFKFVK